MTQNALNSTGLTIYYLIINFHNVPLLQAKINKSLILSSLYPIDYKM